MRKFIQETILNNGEKNFTGYVLADNNDKFILIVDVEDKGIFKGSKYWLTKSGNYNKWPVPEFATEDRAIAALNKAVAAIEKERLENIGKQVNTITHKEII